MLTVSNQPKPCNTPKKAVYLILGKWLLLSALSSDGWIVKLANRENRQPIQTAGKPAKAND
ncbi:hypothetical protein G5C01_06425 [Moraxella bovoculi]|uniref:hypothetical protein n=1 Tax=Moraxella bovoculi TaxID=386891 RepID=UPI00156EA38D|nr:hypothetical protein [Moraxella bovoculi]NSM10990.1 hypothetical protein [Moraxella bovoculi]